MTTPHEAMAKLDGYANELDTLSRGLAETQRQLEGTDDLTGIAEAYDIAISDFLAGMYERYENGEGKWPSEDVRTMLARRSIDRELRDKYDALCAKRDRMRKRISDLKTSVEAQRSILSALKVEMEATR